VHSVPVGHEPQGVSVEQAAKFAEQVRNRGGDPAAALARLGFDANGNLIGDRTGFATEESIQAVSRLSETWKGDPAALKAELNRLGYQEDTRTNAQRAFDQSYAAGDYGLSPHDLFHGFTDMPQQDRVEVTEAISQTMAALGVGRAFGRAVAAGMAKSIAGWNEIAALPLDQQEQALAARDTKTKAVVERVLGKPWAEVMNDLRPIVAQVPAELHDVLARSLESADVLVWLHRSGSFRSARPK